MIGAAVYTLRAENAGRLPAFTGRLMHGAFFEILRDFSPELSEAVHSGSGEKPFAVSALRPEGSLRRTGKYGTEWAVLEGMRFRWRAAALAEPILQAAWSVERGTVIRAGQMEFIVERTAYSPEEDREAGALDETGLIGACLSIAPLRSVTFHFCSPTSFRKDDQDFPWPLPSYIFKSLVRKWNGISSVPFDMGEVEEEAEMVRTLSWEGRTERVYFGSDRGVLAFHGKVSFDLSMLPLEKRQRLLLLAQFSCFSGVGRLTAQGFGQTKVEYR